jgi:DNA modification methylase
MITLYQGHVIEQLKRLPDESIHCVVTSPPYYALRAYGTDAQVWGGESACNHVWEAGERRQIETFAKGKSVNGSNCVGSHNNPRQQGILEKEDTYSGDTCQTCGAWKGELGSEPTPEMFISHLVSIFAEAKRVMRDDAVCWINIGDSYNNKQLQLIPQQLAIALKRDGWYIRSVFPWIKANSLPESAKDRPSTANETVIMATKSPKYFYDGDAVRLPVKPYVSERSRREYEKGMTGDIDGSKYRHTEDFGNGSLQKQSTQQGARLYNFTGLGRNRRTSDSINESIDAAIEHHQTELARLQGVKGKGGLLTDADGMPEAIFVNPKPLKELHYAAYPPGLITPFILTSPKRCCRVCGKGWERRVDYQSYRRDTLPDGHPQKRPKTYTEGKLYSSGNTAQKYSSSKPTGIFPSCECESPHTMIDGYCADCGANTFLRDAEPCWKSAVVLDPFLGSGTTAIVAAELGRDCIGIELKPEYLEMARQRIDNAVGLITPTDAVLASS